MNPATDALLWMRERQRSNGSLWLFRGQSHVYSRIQPSLARLGEEARVVMYNACRRFHVAAAGVTGYAVPSNLDRLGLLQHYVGLSPLLDLTGTPEIALYFALLGSKPEDECVVYALDTEAQPPDERPFDLTDHSFLLLPLNEGGIQHRWIKQDGYGICPKGWPALTEIMEFDLLHVEGLQEYRFLRHEKDSEIVRGLGDLETVENDPLSGHVRAVLNSVLRDLPACHELDARMAVSRTIDLDELLRKDLCDLGDLAAIMQAPARIKSVLEDLIKAHSSNIWDTSFDASLHWVKTELDRLRK